MIQKALSDFPNNILLEDNHSTWTGQELEAHLPLIVKRITQQTLFASRVGICFHNSASLGIAILATHLAGRIPVMINSVDLVEGKIKSNGKNKEYYQHSKKLHSPLQLLLH